LKKSRIKKAPIKFGRRSYQIQPVHKIDSALLAAADRVARHIDDTMGGQKTLKVVQLRKA